MFRRVALVTALVTCTTLTFIDGVANAGDGGGGFVEISTTCDGDQAVLTLAVSDDDDDAYDIFVNANQVADDRVATDGSFTVNVSDAVHHITMLLAGDGTTIDDFFWAASCDEPVALVDTRCFGKGGGIVLIMNEGSAGGTFSVYVDDVLVKDPINPAPAGEIFTYFPDGTYQVQVKWSEAPVEYLFEMQLTLDCQEGDEGQSATVDVFSFCNSSGIAVEVQSFTYGELFTITVDDDVKFEDVYAEVHSVEATDGVHHVVVTNNLGDTLYDDVVLVACEGPVVSARAHCQAGTGEIQIKSLGPDGYTYDVSVDDTPLAAWQDADNTSGEWQSVGPFPTGEHTVLIEWTNGDDNGSQQIPVTVDCTDDGSGTPLPDSGSNATSLLLVAGLFVAAGIGMLGLRRRVA